MTQIQRRQAGKPRQVRQACIRRFYNKPNSASSDSSAPTEGQARIRQAPAKTQIQLRQARQPRQVGQTRIRHFAFAQIQGRQIR